MTPFELSLERELDVEWQRFANEWLFKWHGMTYEGGLTDVEDFRGGRIRYGGILFGYQQQQIFWQAVSRYLTQKVHEVFKRWDVETRGYSLEVRRRSLDGVEMLTDWFARRIVKHAIETDRALRGRGDPSSVKPHGRTAAGMTEVARLANAHRTLLDEEIRLAKPDLKPDLKPEQPFVFWKWIELFYANNKGLIWFVTIAAGAALAAWRLLGS